MVEVQLGKRTGGKVGAPFGNRNRLRHGRYTRARIARHARVRARLRETRNLVCRLDLGTNAPRLGDETRCEREFNDQDIAVLALSDHPLVGR